jgi:lipopolysaccharide/colanic/teichoic acid biosynthesis glycosyltransferase
MKRAFDFTFSLLGLIILCPLFAILGIMIRISDKGPVFFEHLRVGKGGRLFKLYKFRSMSISESGDEGSFEPGNISRVTTIGKFIRKTKLDELPQLINVLKGDMSLVGPRPEIKKWVSVFPDKWEVILTVKPGITDIASVYFRDEESILANSGDPEATYKELILPEKLKHYEKYVLDHSFGGDLKIIFRTLFIIIKKR